MNELVSLQFNLLVFSLNVGENKIMQFSKNLFLCKKKLIKMSHMKKREREREKRNS